MEIIIISSTSDKPIYEQIAVQIKNQLISNRLKTHQQLPSIRKLAKDLHISVITTQKAYDVLQKDGFINTVPCKGAFVSKLNNQFIKEEARKRIREKLKKVIQLSRESNITLDEIIQMLELLYEEEYYK